MLRDLSVPARRETTRPRPATLIAFSVLLLIDLAVVVFLAGGVRDLRAYPFDTDEANHSLPALRMSHDLAEGNISGVLDEIQSQNFYPPVGSFGLIPAFLIFGPSTFVARLASTVSLFLAVLVLFALACEIDPENGWLAGLAAGLLTLTVRPLLLYAGLSMLEAPGLLASLLFLWSYVQSIHRPTVGRFVLASLLLTAVFLTKYSYGVVALGAVLLAELPEFVRVIRQRELGSSLRQRWLPLFGPFAAILLLWFLRPGQLQTFLGYTRPLADSEAWLSLRNAVYYPRSFALHGAPSAWFALVTVVALVWGAIRWRDAGIRVVWLFFVVGMASVMLLNHPPNPRFIAPFVPAAHLLVGLMIAELWQRRKFGSARRRQLATAGLLVVGLLALTSLPTVITRYQTARSVLAARLETSPELAETAEWIAATTGPNAALYLVNYFDQFSPSVVEWAAAVRSRTNPIPVEGIVLEAATPAQTAALQRSVLDGDATHLVLIEGGPWGASFWPDYTAAFGDTLREVDRRSVTLVTYNVADWLDENSLGDEWDQVKADSQQTLELGVIVYAIERP